MLSFTCLLAYFVYLTGASISTYFPSHPFIMRFATLTLNLPTTTIVAQPFNVIKWQLKFNPVA